MLTELWKNIPLNIYFLTKVIKKKVCIGYRRHCSLSSLHCYSLSFICYICSNWGNNLSETAFKFVIPNQSHSKYLSYPKGQKIGHQRRLYLRIFWNVTGIPINSNLYYLDRIHTFKSVARHGSLANLKKEDKQRNKCKELTT